MQFLEDGVQIVDPYTKLLFPINLCIFFLDGPNILTRPYSIMVTASTSEAGGRGFDPGPRHTKDINWLIFSKNSCKNDNLNDSNTVN